MSLQASARIPSCRFQASRDSIHSYTPREDQRYRSTTQSLSPEQNTGKKVCIPKVALQGVQALICQGARYNGYELWGHTDELLSRRREGRENLWTEAWVTN